MHRMHRMEEGTEMSVDTIISGDSTKVIVRVMKRANLAEGQMEDVMIHLDGLGLPEGALSGEPHVFMFKSEAMGGPDMVWNEAAPGAGNAFFMASNKAILGVKLEKPNARRQYPGAFVVEVIPTSTAAAALGLQVTGDIIVAVDGPIRLERAKHDGPKWPRSLPATPSKSPTAATAKRKKPAASSFLLQPCYGPSHGRHDARHARHARGGPGDHDRVASPKRASTIPLHRTWKSRKKSEKTAKSALK